MNWAQYLGLYYDQRLRDIAPNFSSKIFRKVDWSSILWNFWGICPGSIFDMSKNAAWSYVIQFYKLDQPTTNKYIKNKWDVFELRFHVKRKLILTPIKCTRQLIFLIMVPLSHLARGNRHPQNVRTFINLSHDKGNYTKKNFSNSLTQKLCTPTFSLVDYVGL